MGSDRLKEFLDGGALPYVGRSAEIARIVNLWEDASDAEGPRGGLIVAEAGCGKSRLIAETLPRIIEKQGAVVHAKLRPEGIASIGAVLAPALWASESAGYLLKREPEPTLASVVESIRRIAGLRRTLLVIEDVHLFDGATAREFDALLGALAEDSIPLLFTSRPTDLEIRTSIDPILRFEMKLENLDRDCVAEIWRSLFDADADPEVITPLHDATLGNPLALRSALRGAINSGALKLDAGFRGESVVVSQQVFADVVAQSSRRLVHGMISHLSEQDLNAARCLSALGESFLGSAAAIMLGDDYERGVEALRSHGILVDSTTTAASFPAQTGAGPLISFSHTLLHKALVDEAEIDPRLLVRLLASGEPIFSITPYQILGRVGMTIAVDEEEAEKGVRRTQDMAEQLNDTSDWPYIPIVLGAGYALHAAVEWSDERQRLFMHLDLIMVDTHFRRTRQKPETYKELVDYALDLSRKAVLLGEPKFYLFALTYRQNYLLAIGSPDAASIWDEVRAFLVEYPELRYAVPYVHYLREAAHMAGVAQDLERIREIEHELEAILTAEGTTREHRDYARLHVGKYLLMSFTTPEELARREALLPVLDALDGGEIRRRPWTVEYLYRTGRVERTIRECDRLIPYFKDIAFRQSYFSTVGIRAAASALAGGEAGEIAGTFEELAPMMSVPADERTLRKRARECAAALLLRDESAAARKILDDCAVPADTLSLPVRVLLAETDVLSEIRTTISGMQNGDPALSFARMMIVVDDESSSAEEIADAVRDAIRARPLEVRDLVVLSAVLALFGSHIRTEEGDRKWIETAQTVLGPAINAALVWMAERSMHALIPSMIERGGFALSEEDRELWKGSATQIAKARDQERKEHAAPALQVTMFGTIGVRPSGSDAVRVRGARSRTLLGALVADAMLRAPLERVDFFALATGDSEDPDRARRSLNVAVLRLREVLGREAILTDAETPRLNRNIVSVDLLDAFDSLNEARKLAREREFVAAAGALGRTLHLWNGMVPFPGLYDEQFEELREQFENRVRETTITLSRKLTENGDDLAAKELLEPAFAILPEDEEIAELLRDVLRRSGKLAESARIVQG